MFNMIKFYNQKSDKYQFSLCEIRRQLLQMLATGDYYVCFCDGKMFEARKNFNDFVILTSLKSGVFAEIPGRFVSTRHSAWAVYIKTKINRLFGGLFLLQVVIFTR